MNPWAWFGYDTEEGAALERIARAFVDDGAAPDLATARRAIAAVTWQPLARELFRIRTLETRGPVPGVYSEEQAARLEQVSKDLAATYDLSLEEATERVGQGIAGAVADLQSVLSIVRSVGEATVTVRSHHAHGPDETCGVCAPPPPRDPGKPQRGLFERRRREGAVESLSPPPYTPVSGERTKSRNSRGFSERVEKLGAAGLAFLADRAGWLLASGLALGAVVLLAAAAS